MQTEDHGRIRLFKKDTYWTIIEKKKLSDSFDTYPRLILHVGSERYVKSQWNKLKKNSAYLRDPVTLDDYVKSLSKS